MGHLPVLKPTAGLPGIHVYPCVFPNHSLGNQAHPVPGSETRPDQQGSQEDGASFSTSGDNKYSSWESGKKVPYCRAHCPQIRQGDILASGGEEQQQRGHPARL